MFPTTSSIENKNIYVMHVYYCNAILTTAMKSRSYKEMVRAFAEVPEDLKIRRIKPGLNCMDNEGSTAFKMTMTTIYITYQLVTPTNHRANNAQRVIQAFKKHFTQVYRDYQTHKKPTASSHGYGDVANHNQEKDAQSMTADALQALANVTIEYKEAMENITSINFNLSQSPTQAKQAILVL